MSALKQLRGNPVRLKRGLMDAAEIIGEMSHRSAVQQIEYWANIGQKISKSLDDQSLLEVSTGISKLHVEPIVAPPISIDGVFSNLNARREKGDLSKAITHNSIRYQASLKSPGRLEQVHPNGTIKIGMFENGYFIEEK